MRQNETPEQNDPEETPALTRRQLHAMPYLLVAPTLAEAARMAHVGRTTLWRWLKDPVFRMGLERLRSEASTLAREEFQGLVPKALHVLDQLIEHPGWNVRLRSVEVALSVGLKADGPKEITWDTDPLDDALNLFPD